LWRHPDFLKLWAGQTTSQLGSLVGGFALSLIPIMLLNATAAQIALLGAAEQVPALLVSLFAGVLADRVRRRPLMIAVDLGRAVVVSVVPAMAFLGQLTFTLVLVVAVALSLLGACFDVAYRAYLPSIVPDASLIEGNSKLAATAAVSEAAGFTLGGVLIQALTAPVAMLVDAASFVVSAATVGMIATPEQPVARHSAEQQSSLWRDFVEGVSEVWHHPQLRTVITAGGVFNISTQMIGVVIMLFFIRDLHLQAGQMGPLFALGGVSSFGGAVLTARVTRRWGLGETLWRSVFLSGVAYLFLPLAGGPFWFVATLMAAQQLSSDGAWTIYLINEVSIIQKLAAPAVLGRVTATLHTAQWTGRFVGLTLGGVLGQLVGFRMTLFIGGAGVIATALWLRQSSLRTLSE
jgi:hypothetical protein